MNTHLKLQTRFQQLTGQEIKDINYKMPVIERTLRLKLALEELCELSEAFGLENTFSDMCFDSMYKNIKKEDTYIFNQTEVLDALIDIEVINNGTIIACGLETIFDENYKIVDTNNKTKFHKTYLEAVTTQKFYSAQDIKVRIQKIELDNFIFYAIKNELGKTLKPHNYEKVILKF